MDFAELSPPLDLTTREKYQHSLVRNIPSLINDSISKLETDFHSVYRDGFLAKLYFYNPFNFDYDEAQRVINETFNDPANAVFQNSLKTNFYSNSVASIQISQEQYTNIYYPEVQKLRSLYWQDTLKISLFNAFLNENDFLGYQDITFPNLSAALKFQGGRYQLFEVLSWINYYRKLIELFYPQFDHKVTSNGYTYFLKKVKNNVFFGLQLEEQITKIKMQKYGLEDPLLNIVVFIKLQNSENVQVLSVLNHPTFPPAMRFSRFYAQAGIYLAEYNVTRTIYGVKSETFPDGSVRLYGMEDFAILAKMEAYRYFDIQSHFSASYLNYFEKCIEEVF